MSQLPTSSPQPLCCPHCSYDLSHTLDPRCPECGKPFDHSQLAASQIPWIHRKSIGRLKAYRRTLHLFSHSPQKAALEIARPPLYPDANRFRWTSIIFTTLLFTIAATLLFPAFRTKLLPDFHFPYGSGFGTNYTNPLLYPFTVLLDNPVIFPLSLLAIFITLSVVSGLLRLWFWCIVPLQKKRASTLACYLTAWFPILALLISLDGITNAYVHPGGAPLPAILLTLVFVPLPLLLINIYFLIRLVFFFFSFLRRTTHCSLFITLLSATVLPLFALALATLSFLLIDYIAGFLALIFNSLFAK